MRETYYIDVYYLGWRDIPLRLRLTLLRNSPGPGQGRAQHGPAWERMSGVRDGDGHEGAVWTSHLIIGHGAGAYYT